MDIYFVVLFFHISGAFILFMGMSLEWVGVTKLNKSEKLEQAKEWTNFLSSYKSAFIIGGILLLITGIYMASAKWGWAPWMIVSFFLWLFLVIQGSAFTGKKISSFRKYINTSTDLKTSEIKEHIAKMKLINLLQSRLTVGFGAIFIMTVKPDLAGSLIVVLIAFILGLAPFLAKQKIN